MPPLSPPCTAWIVLIEILALLLSAMFQGLEAEVQKLLARHRADLDAAAQRGAEDTRRQLDEQRALHEQALRAMRERLLAEQVRALGAAG